MLTRKLAALLVGTNVGSLIVLGVSSTWSFYILLFWQLVLLSVLVGKAWANRGWELAVDIKETWKEQWKNPSEQEVEATQNGKENKKPDWKTRVVKAAWTPVLLLLVLFQDRAELELAETVEALLRGDGEEGLGV